MNIKPLDRSSDKWTRRARVAQPDYQAGVENPRTAWAAAAGAADGTYRSAVTAAANAGRYGQGVARAGDAKWRKGAVEKGGTRFAEGVALAEGEWQKGFAPYHEAIRALSLPARGPKGSPQNLARVTAIATALRAVRDRNPGGSR